MIVIDNKQIYSDSGKYIHRIGSETYFKKVFAFDTDRIEDFEEVEEVPKYTRYEYIEKVKELIKEKYTIEDELALHRQREAKSNEFAEYSQFCEDCKIRAKELLNNN